jgi:hypothetical protein
MIASLVFIIIYRPRKTWFSLFIVPVKWLSKQRRTTQQNEIMFYRPRQTLTYICIVPGKRVVTVRHSLKRQ